MNTCATLLPLGPLLALLLLASVGVAALLYAASAVFGVLLADFVAWRRESGERRG